MKSIISMHQLVQRELRQFIRSHSVAWVSSLFALMLVLPISLVGSCKEGTSMAMPDVGQVYAQAFEASYDASLESSDVQQHAMDAEQVHVSSSMVKAHKRQVRNLLKNNDQTMVNLQKGEVYLLFSRPELTRKDGNFSSWHYRNEYCVVDVFFEKDEQADLDRVAHYEIRERQMARFVEEQGSQEDAGLKKYSNNDRARCLTALLDRNKGAVKVPQVVVSSLPQ